MYENKYNIGGGMEFMHMADALVAPVVAVTMYAASTVATGYSIRKVSLEQDIKKVPIMGVMGAFVFAAQMVNFTVPGTGSSGHIVGGLLLAAFIGSIRSIYYHGRCYFGSMSFIC